MKASPFRSVSPKGRQATNQNEVTKFGQSMGTTSAASHGRDNPFNQVVHVAGSASRHNPNQMEYTPVAGETSGCSSAIRKINEPSYFSSVKEANTKDAYRTYDNRRDEDNAKAEL